MPGPPAPFVPVPLPNIGKSGDSPKGYSKKVKIEGKAVAIKGATFKSMGDIASKGTGGGLISANTHGPTKFVGPGSLDVKIEGKNVQLLGDPMLNNCGPSGSPPNSATLVGVLQAPGLAALYGDEKCALCGKEHESKLEESEETKGACDQLEAAANRAIAKAEAKRAAQLARLEAEARKAAQEKLAARKAKLQARIEGARGKAPDHVVAAWESDLATMTAEPVKVSLPAASITRMLGIVICDHGKTYGGVSSHQLTELRDEIPGAWHTPPARFSIIDTEEDFEDQLERFKKLVKSKSEFTEAWQELRRKNAEFRKGELREPFYPPGQCAAPQMAMLALQHGGRPAGLTERWFKSGDPTAKVSVFVRDSPSSEPRMGEFGGKDAVPPCGSCQVVLTMLSCPEERPDDDFHKPKEKGQCRCHP